MEGRLRQAALPQPKVAVASDQAEVLFFTSGGKAIRFPANKVNPQATASARGVAGIKVSALVVSMPHMGKIKAKRLLEELRIAENRRLRGLTPRQRADLLASF